MRARQFINEGKQEIMHIVNAIKDVAGRVQEVRQYLEGLIGKPLDQISSQDIYNNVIQNGVAYARAGARMGAREIQRTGYSVGMLRMYLTWNKGDIAKQINAYLPKIMQLTDLNEPTGPSFDAKKRIAVEMDISVQDIDAIIQTYDHLASKFPEAARLFEKGDLEGALDQVIARMLKGL